MITAVNARYDKLNRPLLGGQILRKRILQLRKNIPGKFPKLAPEFAFKFLNFSPEISINPPLNLRLYTARL